MDAGNIEEAILSADVIHGLDRYAFTTDNPLMVRGYMGEIFPSHYVIREDLSIKSWWDKYGGYVITAVTSLVFSVVSLFVPIALPGLLIAGLGLAGAGLSCIAAGYQSQHTGRGFWTGFVDTLVDSMIHLAIGIAVSAAVYGVAAIVRSSMNSCLPKCFAEGTLVQTEDGQKKIEEIEVGDLVLAYDEESGEKAYKKVVRVFRNETTEWHKIKVDDENIKCTAEHPFYVINTTNDTPIVHFEGRNECDNEGQWVAAKNLKVGNKVLLSDGEYGIIKEHSVEKLDKLEITYNFEVEDFHTYYVGENGVLVHNACRADTSINELNHTNGQLRSQKKMGELINDIKENGFQEPIKVAEIKGTKYIVDGNHRVAAARILGMKTVPAQTVSMPFGQFLSVDDVLWANATYVPNWRWK